MYAIEMDDSRFRAYGVIHAQDCRDLRDPMPIGPVWQDVDDFTGWCLDPEEYELAPCAKRMGRD